MSHPVLTIRDQDLSPYVLSWGKLETVRKLKLSDSSLFASKFSIELDNTDGIFTPGGYRSMFPRVGWAGSVVNVSKDGMSIYDGFLWDISLDDEAQTLTLDCSSSMSAASDVVASLTGTGLNPAMACLALLEQAGLGDLADRASFSVAAGFLGSNTVNVTCPASDGTTCLELASSIADICSLDFFLVRGVIYCSVAKPWDGSGLRQEINGDNAHGFQQYASDATNFSNRVAFSYGGAGAVVTVDNEASQRAERRVISAAVDATTSAKVSVLSETIAEFYARLLLARISPRRMLLTMTLGQDFLEVLPAWRYPVTYAGLNMQSQPFEVNEVTVDLDTDTIDVTAQSLENA